MYLQQMNHFASTLIDFSTVEECKAALAGPQPSAEDFKYYDLTPETWRLSVEAAIAVIALREAENAEVRAKWDAIMLEESEH